MHITKFVILSAVATLKHLFSFSPSSTEYVKPTHYDETQTICCLVVT